MDDNIDCSPDTAAFSDGYKAGWKARGEYILDYRNANTGIAVGLALMLMGAMAFSFIGVAAIAYAPPLSEAIIPLLVSLGIGVAGYFINRLEAKSYQKRQDQFKEKWGD
jgi:Na+/proline symporter